MWCTGICFYDNIIAIKGPKYFSFSISFSSFIFHFFSKKFALSAAAFVVVCCCCTSIIPQSSHPLPHSQCLFLVWLETSKRDSRVVIIDIRHALFDNNDKKLGRTLNIIWLRRRHHQSTLARSIHSIEQDTKMSWFRTTGGHKLGATIYILYHVLSNDRGYKSKMQPWASVWSSRAEGFSIRRLEEIC